MQKKSDQESGLEVGLNRFKTVHLVGKYRVDLVGGSWGASCHEGLTVYDPGV